VVLLGGLKSFGDPDFFSPLAPQFLGASESFSGSSTSGQNCVSFWQVRPGCTYLQGELGSYGAVTQKEEETGHVWEHSAGLCHKYCYPHFTDRTAEAPEIK
jgi:hypothetical protein